MFDADRITDDLLSILGKDGVSFDFRFQHTVSHKQRKYLGMSILGHPCERHLWFIYRRFTAIEFDERLISIFIMGHFVERYIEALLLEAGYKIINQQQHFSDLWGQVAGHPDGTLITPIGQHLMWDAKSANKSSFSKMKREGLLKAKPVYYAQAQLMMKYSGLLEAAYTIYCKDNSDIHVEIIKYDRSYAARLIEKARRVILANDMPEVGFEKHNNMYCRFCNYKHFCYAKKTMRIVQKHFVCTTCKHFHIDNHGGNLIVSCNKLKRSETIAGKHASEPAFYAACNRASWRFKNV